MAHSGLREWCLVAVVMLEWVRRSRLSAVLRSVAMTRGRLPVRTWERPRRYPKFGITTTNPNAVRLVAGAGGQDCGAECRWIGSPVDVTAFGAVFRDRAFDDSLPGACATGWQDVGQERGADAPDEVDGDVAESVRGADDLVAGSVEGDREGEPVGIDAGPGQSGIADRDAECLIGDQDRPEFLGDRGRIPAAHDTSAQDRRFQLAVGGLDLPALVVEPDQSECGSLAGVQSGVISR